MRILIHKFSITFGLYLVTIVYERSVLSLTAYRIDDDFDYDIVLTVQKWQAGIKQLVAYFG